MLVPVERQAWLRFMTLATGLSLSFSEGSVAQRQGKLSMDGGIAVGMLSVACGQCNAGGTRASASAWLSLSRSAGRLRVALEPQVFETLPGKFPLYQIEAPDYRTRFEKVIVPISVSFETRPVSIGVSAGPARFRVYDGSGRLTGFGLDLGVRGLYRLGTSSARPSLVFAASRTGVGSVTYRRTGLVLIDVLLPIQLEPREGYSNTSANLGVQIEF